MKGMCAPPNKIIKPLCLIALFTKGRDDDMTHGHNLSSLSSGGECASEGGVITIPYKNTVWEWIFSFDVLFFCVLLVLQTTNIVEKRRK